MRRTSTDGRPKREIHPTNKDLESSIKKRPGKKEDPQMKYLLKHVDELMSKKAYSSWAAPFHYPVGTYFGSFMVCFMLPNTNSRPVFCFSL